MRALLLALMVAGLAGSAWAQDIVAGPDTRLGPGFTIRLNVSVKGIDEPELCGSFPLDGEGAVQLTIWKKPLDKITLRGQTCEQAAKTIGASIRKYYAVPPEVIVKIAHVPRIQVWVEGAARQTGTVTLPMGARLSSLVAAVGFLPSADLHSVQVARSDGGARTLLKPDLQRVLETPGQDDPVNDPPLHNGDAITIEEAVVAAPPQQVSVLGEVRKQGRINYRPGITVRDAIQAAQGLLPTADPDRLTLFHRDGTLVTISASRALQNVPTDNLKLAPDDLVLVRTLDTGQRYSVVGAVAAQQGFEYKGAVTLSKAIADCGGLRPDADPRGVVILRNMLNDPAHVQPVAVDFERIHKGEMPDVPLQPGDMVQVPPKKRSPNPFWSIVPSLLRLFFL